MVDFLSNYLWDTTLACGPGRHALLLAAHGWRVTGVDGSATGIALLRNRAAERGLQIETAVQDLESVKFAIEAERYDLICDCCYLQRSLISRIRSGVRPGGLAAIALPMFDETPGLKPMNASFLVHPGEVRGWFDDWEIVRYKEDSEPPGWRKTARLIARRPGAASPNA